MKQYNFLNGKIGRWAFGAILFLMLLLARDTMITTVILGFTTSQFLMLGLISIVVLLFLAVNRKKIKAIVLDRRMTAAVIATAVLLIPMLVKRDWQLMYFSVLICLYFAIFLTYFISCREVARYYIVLLTGLALYSLLATYVLKGLAVKGILSVPVITNSADNDFYNFGLCVAYAAEYIKRNCGIFREPGVYQFFLILALFLNNYTVIWDKPWKLWAINGILAVTMLTTFSTNGIIELALLVLLVMTDRKLYKDKRVIAAGVIAVAAVLTAVYVSYRKNGILFFTLEETFSKLFRLNGSSAPRVEAVITDLRIFLQSPVFGDRIETVMYAVAHNTTSTMLLYAIFGLAGGTLNVAAWGALVWDRNRHTWKNLALLVILFMSFNTQNLIADVFFWLFPTMALAERGLPLFNRK